MILSCSSCGASFKVDSALIAAEGRSVRCGNCGHSWHQMPEAVGSEAAPGAGRSTRAVRASSLDKLDEQRRRSRSRRPVVSAKKPRNRAATIGWILLSVVVLAIGAGGLLAREEIIAAVPGSEPLYEMLGLEESLGEGLDLQDVTSVRQTIDGERALVIRGVIVNKTGRPRIVPRLQASLTDAGGVELTSWVFASDSSELPPGGLTTFETQTANPPGAGELHLVFIE